MASVKKNLYTPGQNLNNQAANIDLNRVSMDRSFITVNYAGATPVVTIKVGSLVEVAGAMYAVETADNSLTFSSAVHFYIGYDGSAYTSHATKGTFDPLRGGYYQTGDVRTLRWYVNDASKTHLIDADIENSSVSDGRITDGIFRANRMGKFASYITSGTPANGTIVFDTENFDILGEYNSATGIFTASRDGYYYFNSTISFFSSFTSSFGTLDLKKNGTASVHTQTIPPTASGSKFDANLFSLIVLSQNDTVEIVLSSLSGSFTYDTSFPTSNFIGYLIV